MAILLLQDCLIDLTDNDKCTDIILNPTLVSNISQRGTFELTDNTELLDCLDEFFKTNNYQSFTLIVSMVFFSIPFFVEELENRYNVNIVSILDYLNNNSFKELKIVEIGNYLLSKSTFNYNTNRISNQSFEIFNHNNQIVRRLTDKQIKSKKSDFLNIQRINKINKGLKDYSEEDLKFTQLYLIENCGFNEIFNPNSITAKDFFSLINQSMKEKLDSADIVVSKTSFISLFSMENLLKFEDRPINKLKKMHNSQFRIDLLPHDKLFEEEAEIEIWRESKKHTLLKLIDTQNNITINYEINHIYDSDNYIKRANIDLQYSKLYFKSDIFGNLSCKITEISNNRIIMSKIHFI